MANLISKPTANTLGHILGLLEAWIDYSSSINPDLSKLTKYQKARLRELVDCVPSNQVVAVLEYGDESEKVMFRRVVEAVYSND